LRSGDGTRGEVRSLNALNLCSSDILRSLSLIGIDVDVDLSDSTLSVEPLRGDENVENVVVDERTDSGESRLGSSAVGLRILMISTDKRRPGSVRLDGSGVFSSIGSLMMKCLSE
jgi:hypothetical protein